jgi:hypothetical protein
MTVAAPVAPAVSLILSIGIAPPPLPVYEQPVCPGDGYIWTPGYWAYCDDGYFWVPGTWALIPEPGLLWTPAYWGWADGVFVFHEGYWGPQVGFYGGINYGFGYIGIGYEGGYWRDGAFFYNRAVDNVTNVTNVYNKTVVNNVTVNNVSYNGGTGGTTARPTPQEQAAAQVHHTPPTAAQVAHIQAASANRQLYESVNRGKPAVAATSKPSQFSGSAVVTARAAAPSYKPVTERAVGAPGGHNAMPANGNARGAVHPNDMPPAERSAPPNTGDKATDQKFQREQDELNAQQEKERQTLQREQEQEHQRSAQEPANSAKNKQLEQKHQQQTQQLSQRHAQEQQQLQQRHQEAAGHPPKH